MARDSVHEDERRIGLALLVMGEPHAVAEERVSLSGPAIHRSSESMRRPHRIVPT
jgi:hypothetical protein